VNSQYTALEKLFKTLVVRPIVPCRLTTASRSKLYNSIKRRFGNYKSKLFVLPVHYTDLWLLLDNSFAIEHAFNVSWGQPVSYTNITLVWSLDSELLIGDLLTSHCFASQLVGNARTSAIAPLEVITDDFALTYFGLIRNFWPQFSHVKSWTFMVDFEYEQGVTTLLQSRTLSTPVVDSPVLFSVPPLTTGIGLLTETSMSASTCVYSCYKQSCVNDAVRRRFVGHECGGYRRCWSRRVHFMRFCRWLGSRAQACIVRQSPVSCFSCRLTKERKTNNGATITGKMVLCCDSYGSKPRGRWQDNALRPRATLICCRQPPVHVIDRELRGARIIDFLSKRRDLLMVADS
jgi:hypothetical protein